jgi:hypothetical protein
MFNSMIREILTQQTPKRVSLPVTLDAYNEWKRLYTFQGLKGQRYGQSFCNHFDIQDHRVFFDQDWQRCDEIIQRDWIIELHTE